MKSKICILIVDGDLILLESLKMQLESFIPDELILEAASSFEESEFISNDLAEQNIPIAIVITDFNLENYKGTDVIRMVRKKNPNSINAILTGQYDTKAIQELVNEIKLDFFFSKPWHFEEIKNFIESSIEIYDKREV
jgi:thioredoxin reductase (NADPH)